MKDGSGIDAGRERRYAIAAKRSFPCRHPCLTPGVAVFLFVGLHYAARSSEVEARTP